MRFNKGWRYQDAHGAGWPGTSEIVAVSTFARDLAPAARKAAERFGTPAHNGIAGLLAQIAPDAEGAADCGPVEIAQTPEVRRAVGAWLEWHADAGAPCPVSIERTYFGDGYAGTVDSVFDNFTHEDVNYGRTVIDWKTTGSPETLRRLWPKYRIQISAYGALVEGAESAGLVVLDRNTGMYSVHVWRLAELAAARELYDLYVAAFWLRVREARNEGRRFLHGYDLDNLYDYRGHNEIKRAA